MGEIIINTTKIILSEFIVKRRNIISVILFSAMIMIVNPSHAQEDIDVGVTGWDVKRPVMASACDNGCPWGELGDFMKGVMEPYGYSVILCRNCNRNYGSRLVSEHDYPPPLDEINLNDGVNVRVNARVDFGVTSSAMLASNYRSYPNLRLIAKVEDPYYFLVAAKKESGITDFSQIKERQLPVRILGAGGNMTAILNHYGITADDIEAWGGELGITVEDAIEGDFDIISGFLASPAMNPESAWWTTLSQKFDLYFIELPEELLKIMAEQQVDAEFVEVQNSLLRGVNRRIKTLGRSGESFFARDDTPEQAVYDMAKAIDENRGALKWFIRIYTYDPNTVWNNFGVPLHPGAERYYREVGYIK
ncbi:TAXI family TRAP transporter solute-binding subunit [Candidatus Latescibacterota bacterium]